MSSQDLIKKSGASGEHGLVLIFIRSLIIITIVALLLGAIVVVAGGVAELYRIVFFLVSGGFGQEGLGRYLAVNMTELIDLFLIAIVLIIIALGLYQLFIDPDIDLPDWLNTSSLESLKIRLLVVIVVLLTVIFLGAVAESEGGIEIAGMGIGIALVILAIGYVLSMYIRTQFAIRRSSDDEYPENAPPLPGDR